LFQFAYNFSTALSIVLLLVYTLTLIAENVYRRKGIQTESEGIQKKSPEINSESKMDSKEDLR
jgi:Ca2+/H+ antiporter